MSKYLQKKFALSGQGGKDLTKAIFCCALTNISLMFPDLGIGGYVGISVVLLAVIGFFEHLQNNATFLSSYQESANMRIRLAERLRKLPLSFFGK